MAGFAAHVLDAVRDFLVSAVHHRALHRIAEVAAGALGHVAAVRVGVAAFGALEAFFGRFEVTFETAFVATVDWRVRAEIADADGIDPRTIRSAGLVQSMAQRIQDFNPDSVSKAVDDNGEPLVVYHGTNADFDVFRSGDGMFGPGIYLARQADYAAGFADESGGNIMPVFAKITGKNDGRILPDKRGGVFIAFAPTQIKSALGNRGAFDAKSPDITKAWPFPKGARFLFYKTA